MSRSLWPIPSWSSPRNWWRTLLRNRLGPAVLVAAGLDKPPGPNACRQLDAAELTEAADDVLDELMMMAYIGVPANTTIDLAELQPGAEPYPAPPPQDLAATNYEQTSDLDAIIAREERILAELAAASHTSTPLEAAQTVFGLRAGRHGR